MLKKYFGIFFLLLIAGIATGCESRGNASSAGEDSITRHSSLLRISDREGYSRVRILNPWDSTQTLALYYLVDKDKKIPAHLGDSARWIVRVPVSDALVYSNVHVSLLKELGTLDAVKGVTDAAFVTDTAARRLLSLGKITDAGLSSSPNIELIMQMRPDVIIAAPMSDTQGHGKLDNLGIPMIEAADFAEKTPLGRAEWIRFYGRLVGKGMEADSIFSVVEKKYQSLVDLTKNVSTRPAVIFDGIYGGNWFVPTSASVTGAFIRDAGGRNPFDTYDDSGSARLSPEEVFFKGSKARIWFVRYFSPKDYTLADWVSQYDIYKNFDAVRNHDVYGTNTSYSGAFDDAAFHPHWVLADMIRVIHPEIKGVPDGKRYYHRLQ